MLLIMLSALQCAWGEFPFLFSRTDAAFQVCTDLDQLMMHEQLRYYSEIHHGLQF